MRWRRCAGSSPCRTHAAMAGATPLRIHGLRDFFHERYVASHVAWHARYVAYGTTCLDRLQHGVLASSAVSRYVLRHLGDHLLSARAPVDQLAALTITSAPSTWSLSAAASAARPCARGWQRRGPMRSTR